jgi:hypothetical protein
MSFARQLDGVQTGARTGPLEALAPVNLGRGSGGALRGLPEADASLPVDGAHTHTCRADQVQRLAGHANVEERDFAPSEPHDPDALDVSRTEVGLHLSPGAIAWDPTP